MLGLGALLGCSGEAGTAGTESAETTDYLWCLDTGSGRFQAGESTRRVRFEGGTLYTLSTRVQRWNALRGEELGALDEPRHSSFNGDEELHVSPTRGFLGYSDGGRYYPGIAAQEPTFHAKGTGYQKVAYVEAMDAFAGYGSEAIQFFSRESGELQSSQPLSQGIVLVAGGPLSYATAIPDHRIVVWPCSEEVQGLVLKGHGAKVVQMLYSPSGATLVSADAQGVVIAWELAGGTEIRRFEIPVSKAVPAVALAMTPNEQALLANGSGQGIPVWSMATGELLSTIVVPHHGILSMDVSGDGLLLAVGTAYKGRYDQNASRKVTEEYVVPGLLESGPAYVFDLGKHLR